MSNYTELKSQKAKVEYTRDQLGHNAAWALRGLKRIYEYQTAAEQAAEDTREWNNVGFTGADGHILTSFAKQYERRGSLSEKQMGILFTRMPKYARQLVKIAEGKQ